jgi:hypothetical protein
MSPGEWYPQLDTAEMEATTARPKNERREGSNAPAFACARAGARARGLSVRYRNGLPSIDFQGFSDEGAYSVGLLFDIAVGIELFEVGPKVVDLLIVLDAGESHFRARDFGLGILDVFLEGRLIHVVMLRARSRRAMVSG